MISSHQIVFLVTGLKKTTVEIKNVTTFIDGDRVDAGRHCAQSLPCNETTAENGFNGSSGCPLKMLGVEGYYFLRSPKPRGGLCSLTVLNSSAIFMINTRMLSDNIRLPLILF